MLPVLTLPGDPVLRQLTRGHSLVSTHRSGCKWPAGAHLATHRPVTKDDIGDKNNIYFQFRRGREEGRRTWVLLNFLFFIIATRMLATRRQYASWTKHIRGCTMTLDCLRGHRLIVVRCGGRVVCCFFCDPFICLNKSLSRVTPTLHIRTQQQPAARHCHLFSWLNSGSDGIK